MQGSPRAAVGVSFTAGPSSGTSWGFPGSWPALRPVASLGGSWWGQGSFPNSQSLSRSREGLRGGLRTADVACHFLPSQTCARPVRPGTWWANLSHTRKTKPRGKCPRGHG